MIFGGILKYFTMGNHENLDRKLIHYLTDSLVNDPENADIPQI